LTLPIQVFAALSDGYPQIGFLASLTGTFTLGGKMTTSMQTEEQKPIIKPFPINKPSYKIMDVFNDDGSKFTLIGEYRRLDSSNLRILLDKEKSTKRITETLTKNRSRDKLDVDDSHENFFNALVLQGSIQVGDEGVQPLSYIEMVELNIEQKIGLNVRFLDCKSKVQKVTGTSNYDFLFKKDGNMILEFMIGDPEDPTYTLLMKTKRPPQGRRSKFREDFAYGVTHRGGDLPITQTVIDIGGGVRFFDEHFETIIIDPNYSEVHFLKEDGSLDHVYQEGSEDDRKLFIQYFNPSFKTDLSGAIVGKFNKSRQE
jgi:hypothetical protein